MVPDTTSPTPVPTASRLAIKRLAAQKPLTPEAIDAFLAEHRVPIVEGRRVTFIYRGDAEEVYLQHWIFGLTSSQPFTRIQKTDLWYRVEEIPENSRVEYKLLLRYGDDHQLVMDPLNPLHAHDPFGANSVCQTAGYEVPDWTKPDPEARIGTLDRRVFKSRFFDDERRVDLYLPARFRRTRRYPLVIVHDGGDYLRYSGLKSVLDNLVHRLEIPGLVAALVYPRDRTTEYANDPRHAQYITEEILPWLEKELPLLDRPSARCLMGASLGAVASFTTAARYPGRYGRLLLQSGSFAFTDIGPNRKGPVFEPIVRFINAYRDDPVAVSEKVFLTCGTYEPLIYENRSLVPLLQLSGMELRYVEARDGHNWENWRDRLREGLSWLFPGPLWMVYE